MKIGLCNGCFDLFHRGHRVFLRAAAMQCTILIVAVNHDAWITENKGSNRPFDRLGPRMAAVRNYGWELNANHRRSGQFVVIPFSGEATALAEVIRPDVVFRGSDQAKDDVPRNIPVEVIDRLQGFSTTLTAQQRGLE